MAELPIPDSAEKIPLDIPWRSPLKSNDAPIPPAALFTLKALANISESINTYLQHDYAVDTNFFSQELNTFECLSFLSDGKQILKPKKLKMIPYFK